MKQIWQLTTYEIKLIVRSKTCWLLTLLAVALVLFPGFCLLMLELLVLIVLSRDERAGLAEIITALPYDSGSLYLARALALLCLMAGMWPFMLGAIVIWGGTAEWLWPGASLVLLTLKYLITCLVAIGMTFLAHVALGSRGRLYLGVGLSWLIGWLLAGNSLSFRVWGILFNFGHGLMLPSAPSLGVGYFPYQGILSRLAMFQGTLALLFLLIAIAWQMQKRGESRSGVKRVCLLIAIVAVMVLVSGGIVIGKFDERNNYYHWALREAQRREPEMEDTKVEVRPKLASYHLNINLQTAGQRLTGRARLKLGSVDSSGLITFTLRPYLKVRQIRVVGYGKSPQWRRDGSQLLVRLPPELVKRKAVLIEIDYSGRVWEWFSGRSSNPNGPVNYITPFFSLLRSGYAWYPIPGTFSLFTLETYFNPWTNQTEPTLWSKPALHAPVPFWLTVNIDSDRTVLSNLDFDNMRSLTGKYKKQYRFYSRQAQDLFLMTGPYSRQKKVFPNRQGTVEVYCYRQHRQVVDRVINSLYRPFGFYKSLFQPNRDIVAKRFHSKQCTVVEVPPFFNCTEDGDAVRNVTLTDTILLTENFFRTEKKWPAFLTTIQANKRDLAVLQRWWPEDPTRDCWKREGSISEGLMLYFYSMWLEKRFEKDFFPKVRQNLKTGNSNYDQFTLPFVAGGPVIRDVFTVLDLLRTADSNATQFSQTVRRLYQVYRQKKSVSAPKWTQVVEATLQKGNYPATAKAKIKGRLKRITQRLREPEHRKMKLLISTTIFTFNQEEWLP
jgi:hypothetical protein